jgi:hypothetical protein
VSLEGVSMVNLKDIESLHKLAFLLVVPFFTAASMIDHTFDSILDVVLFPLMWWVRNVTSYDPDLAEFALGCFILVGIIGAILIGLSVGLWATDRMVAQIPLVGEYLTVLLWIGLTCITAGLFVAGFVIPGLPQSPLNPFWHLGLLCYGIVLIDIGAPR